MPIVVIAKDQADFEQWVAQEAATQAAAKAEEQKLLSMNMSKEELMALGEKTYMGYCAACHQPTGMGIPGVFPALKGSAIVNGSSQELIDLLLKGRKGKDGSAMPAFSFLKDEEMRALINYIRNSWGNKAASVNKEIIFQKRS